MEFRALVHDALRIPQPFQLPFPASLQPRDTTFTGFSLFKEMSQFYAFLLC